MGKICNDPSCTITSDPHIHPNYEQRVALEADLMETVVNLSVQNTRLLGLVEDFCRQFGFDVENPAGLSTGGFSVLEEAFEVLGWSDPHPTPEMACDELGCGKVATCGFPVEGGKYRRTCGFHFHPQEEK